MEITTPAFAPGKLIPCKHTGEGEDASPLLQWSGVPAGAVELALIVDDPDAPTPQPWVHWVIYAMSPKLTGLPGGVPRKTQLVDPAGALQGVNTWPTDNVGYRGPMPPPGHGVHRYFFKLYALDKKVGLPAKATKEQVLAAMKGHVLAEAQMIGTYERK